MFSRASIPQGGTVSLGVAGTSVTVINAALLDPAPQTTTNQPNAQPTPWPESTIYGAFDRTPTPGNWDFVVPPGYQVTVPVPSIAAKLGLLASGPAMMPTTGTIGSAEYMIAWVNAPIPPGISRIEAPLVLNPAGPVGTSGFWFPKDQTGHFWTPTRPVSLYDQDMLGLLPSGPHIRPWVAPSIVDTSETVLLAATAADVSGAAGFGTAAHLNGITEMQLILKRMILTYTVATRVVVGLANIGAAPNGLELFRGTLQAGVPFQVDYAEGFEVNAFAIGGPIKAYATLAGTLQITYVGG
jgi:hypothetical protein